MRTPAALIRTDGVWCAVDDAEEARSCPRTDVVIILCRDLLSKSDLAALTSRLPPEGQVHDLDQLLPPRQIPCPFTGSAFTAVPLYREGYGCPCCKGLSWHLDMTPEEMRAYDDKVRRR